MPVALLILLLAGALWTQPPAAAQAPAASTESPLDFEFFRTKVQPIFLTKRDGNARCYSCHSKAAFMRLQELPAGTTAWTEEQSRRNFRAVAALVIPFNLAQSRLLMHPLASDAGGDFYHYGGKHWNSILSTEWQTLANWVCGRKAADELTEVTGWSCPKPAK